MEIVRKQKIARVGLMALAVIQALAATAHVVNGNWLGLLNAAILVGLNVVAALMVGQNMRLAERNAALEAQLHPDEVRARRLHIAKLERDLGMTREAL